MAETNRTSIAGALALRGSLAAFAVVAYLVARPHLDPAPLVVARFGLGILFFTLLLDVGRTMRGKGPAIQGALGPHEQQARSQVDEDYAALRRAIDRYLSDGAIDDALTDAIDQAASAQGHDEATARSLERRVQEAAQRPDETYRPLGVRLVAGLVVAVGLAFAVATLAQGLGLAVIPLVLLVTGTSVATVQWRAQAAGARWTGLAIGLTGAGLFGLGAARVFLVQPGPGLALAAIAALIATGTAIATWRTENRPEPWRLVKPDLESYMDTLRQAFLVTLVTGIVVVPLEPFVASALTLAGLPSTLAFDLALIGFATVAAFLALEGAGTYLALERGRDSVERRRRLRSEALDDVLDEIDADTPEAIA